MSESIGRKKAIERVAQMVKLLQTGRHSAREISKDTGICIRSVYRYIEALSSVFDVDRDASFPARFSIPGPDQETEV